MRAARRLHRIAGPALVLCLALPLPACGDRQAAEAGAVPPPIADCADPYACAAKTHLDAVPPTELEGLHHLYRLSPDILCGGEPLTAGALGALADMGVRTILSVDGKAPNAEEARRRGMRYVHVPIRYGGMTREEMLQIAKTFREREAPFYVHCFHGKHRGPCAAAVGRIVLDGASREQALAEMRQWCGTAAKYTGLYRTIATGRIPSAKETAAYDWDFPEVHRIEGFRAGMVQMTRTFDNVKWLGAHGWRADPAHPDLDPVNETAQLAQHFEQMAALPEVARRPEDFRRWLQESVPAARALRDAVKARTGDPVVDPAEDPARRLEALQALCAACHEVYRNK